MALPTSISPSKLVEILANVVKEQKSKLQDIMESNQPIPHGIYLPDVKHGETLTDYFIEICGEFDSATDSRLLIASRIQTPSCSRNRTSA